MMLKIFIAFTPHDGPTGGGNQFLKALSRCMRKKGCCTDSVEDAQTVLFNSHHHVAEVLQLKKRFPEKIFVHRVDGPMRLYNEPTDTRDMIVNTLNRFLADGTVFQSRWSREHNHRLGFPFGSIETTILNAPDPELFSPGSRDAFDPKRRIRLIATSWSSNIKKGFDVYRWLDDHLDFNRYEFVFIGNTPVPFKNIIHIPPLPGRELAAFLKKSDIFITASRNDPCSNALLEALHCGLPALALNDGGHPEIVKNGGRLFESPGEIPHLLEEITAEYERYQKAIDVPGIDEVADAYYAFIHHLYTLACSGRYIPKKFSYPHEKSLRLALWLARCGAAGRVLYQGLFER